MKILGQKKLFTLNLISNYMSEIGTKIFGLSKPRLGKKTWQGIETVMGKKMYRDSEYILILNYIMEINQASGRKKNYTTYQWSIWSFVGSKSEILFLMIHDRSWKNSRNAS